MYFVFPPRPRSEINPSRLPEFDNGTWWAQFKYNGTRTQIHVHADGTVRDFERHGKPHRQYVMSDAMKRALLALDLGEGLNGGGVAFDGEVMHSKTKDLKGTIVLYDILWWQGKYLFGSQVDYRYNLLTKVCRNPSLMDPKGRALLVTPTLWLAPTFTTDFVRLWRQAEPDDAREGLVLKRPSGLLTNLGGGSPAANEVTWQVKCRKSHKNYQW